MTYCKIDRKKRIDRDKFTFTYTADSYLFFKNVRQIYYDFQDLPKARWHAFRHSDRYKGDEMPSINPVIVIDWFNEQANLLIEPNSVLQAEDKLVVRERNPTSGRWYEYSLTERGRENMLEFATKIYEGIMAEHEVYVVFRGRNHPLFHSPEDADVFRVVLADYFRLCRII